jgi:hypothetical protein
MGLAKIKGQNGKDFTGTKWCYIHCDFCMAALISMKGNSIKTPKFYFQNSFNAKNPQIIKSEDFCGMDGTSPVSIYAFKLRIYKSF